MSPELSTIAEKEIREVSYTDDLVKWRFNQRPNSLNFQYKKFPVQDDDGDGIAMTALQFSGAELFYDFATVGSTL